MEPKPAGSGQANQPEPPLRQRIEQAHQQIREFFDRGPGASEELGQTRALLATLPKVLAKHFEDEEGPGGLFEGMRAIRPSVDPQLKFLQREHRQILEAVEALERRIQEHSADKPAEERDQDVARIQDDTAALLRMIRRHEETETRLVADLEYTEDGGSG